MNKKYFEEITNDAITRKNVQTGKLMNCDAITAKEKVIAAYDEKNKSMIFKLGKNKEEEIKKLGIQKWKYLNPFKEKPPMKGWYVIPETERKHWKTLTNKAINTILGPPKKTKKEFKEYTLTTGRIIHAGKNSTNNDKLVQEAKQQDILLHTEAPGSPFINIGTKPNKKELEEASIICAAHSQTWRDNKTNTKINIFKRSDMKKNKNMKRGTWKVQQYKETITTKKKDIKKYEKEQHTNTPNKKKEKS